MCDLAFSYLTLEVRSSLTIIAHLRAFVSILNLRKVRHTIPHSNSSVWCTVQPLDIGKILKNKNCDIMYENLCMLLKNYSLSKNFSGIYGGEILL